MTFRHCALVLLVAVSFGCSDSPTPPSACAYSISPTSASAAAAGGSFTVSVSRSSGTCGWTAAADSPWITLQGATSGSASGTIAYAVSANAGAARSGRITVTWDAGSAQQTISQLAGSTPPPSSSFTVSGTVTDGTSGGRLPNVRIAISGGADEGRSTTTDPSGNFSFSNVSAGSRTFTASATGYVDSTRTADISADTRIDIVLNRVAVCAGSFASATQDVAASGGNFAVALSATQSTCTWSASSDAPWLTVSPLSGTGNGTLNYSVTPNTGVARTAHILVTFAGGTAQLTVNQSAGALQCVLTVTTTSVTVDATGGTASIGVSSTGSTCAWTAQSSASFIAITSGSSGTGNGTATIAVQSNGGSSSRSGTVTIAGQAVTINQSAPLTRLMPATGCASGGQSLQEDTLIQFINTRTDPITITDGGQSLTVAPNSGINQSTKVGTKWAVTAGSTCLGNYTAQSGGRSAVVTSQGAQ